ncbi:Ig-like domain-containing protein, partial [Methanotrichaceae archaeon M04Ac]|nr:Ig-like domain-containing protein [Candidatus Methanocrinis alkalitolerans]
ADKSSPQNAGTSILWTASATDPDGDAIQYRFWLKGPSTGNAWVEKRGWSTVNTWSWTTTNADVGANQVNVWVRDGNHAPASSYDSFKIADFAITAQNQPPVANSLNADKSSPQNAGTSILWTASATDPDGDAIQYRFWLKGPSTGNAWVEKRGWSTDNTWSWTTTNSDVGANQVNVWVRDGNHEPATSYDSFKIADFAITAQNQPPVANSLTADKSSPQNAGTSILWTASGTDPDGDSIQYRFWLKGPSTGNAWVEKRGWSTVNTWSWTTTNADVGANQVNVWVRDGNHAPASSYDSFKIADFAITAQNQPPVANSLNADKSSPQNAGTSILWTASATDPDGDAIQYRFWLKGPSTANAWVEKRGWSTVNTWSWTTTNADVGANQVNVWV